MQNRSLLSFTLHKRADVNNLNLSEYKKANFFGLRSQSSCCPLRRELGEIRYPREKYSLWSPPASTFGHVRAFSQCCPPRPPTDPCGCPAPPPPSRRRIVPPSNCRPGPIPPNPCVPVFHQGHNTWKKPKYIFFLISVPLMIIQAVRVYGIEPHKKVDCRDYEYMRRRTKRFPWGDGTKSLLHNDHTNHLPGECESAPLECD